MLKMEKQIKEKGGHEPETEKGRDMRAGLRRATAAQRPPRLSSV